MFAHHFVPSASFGSRSDERRKKGLTTLGGRVTFPDRNALFYRLAQTFKFSRFERCSRYLHCFRTLVSIYTQNLLIAFANVPETPLSVIPRRRQERPSWPAPGHGSSHPPPAVHLPRLETGETVSPAEKPNGGVTRTNNRRMVTLRDQPPGKTINKNNNILQNADVVGSHQLW